MVASTLGEISEAGSVPYVAAAVLLAFLSGAILLGMGLARLGFLVNFLSHPVISGFSSAAALIIGLSQLKHILGFDIPRSHLITETIWYAIEGIGAVNLATLALALAGFGLLLLFNQGDRMAKVYWTPLPCRRVAVRSIGSGDIHNLGCLGS